MRSLVRWLLVPVLLVASPNAARAQELEPCAHSPNPSGANFVNLGTNRWAFKPELGLSHPPGRLYLDVYAEAAIRSSSPGLRAYGWR